MDYDSIRDHKAYRQSLVDLQASSFATPYPKGALETTHTYPIHPTEKLEFLLAPKGDYLYSYVLQLDVPEVQRIVGPLYHRWTRNLGHAMLRKASLWIDNVEIASIDGTYLDFVATYDETYQRRIGSVEELINPVVEEGDLQVLPAYQMSVPLPFPTLPMFRLQQRVVKVVVELRPYADLLVRVNPHPFPVEEIPAHSSGNATLPGTSIPLLLASYSQVHAQTVADASTRLLRIPYETMAVGSDWTLPLEESILKDVHVAFRNITVPNDFSNYLSVGIFARKVGIDPYVTTCEYPAPKSTYPLTKIGLRYPTGDRFPLLPVSHYQEKVKLPGHYTFSYRNPVPFSGTMTILYERETRVPPASGYTGLDVDLSQFGTNQQYIPTIRGTIVRILHIAQDGSLSW